MIESEILEKLQETSIVERIQIIEAILRSVKNNMRKASEQQILPGQYPLRGKVIRYDDPYEPAVAAEDWEALARSF
ncbi:MAG: hypothetical protein GDA48_05040 [Hormoscilla sp. GM102CHS1]|nr:hypothetical protein [Hormoscilla sp. GM102CHS1]